MLKETIFREYDIRGIAESELRNEDLSQLAAGLAARFGRDQVKTVILGRDVRPSSERIREILVTELLSYGFDIIDIGLVPTPLVYFGLFQLKADAALIITASHNPAEYNGLKIMVGRDALFGDQIKELYHLAQKSFPRAENSGTLKAMNIREDYFNYIENSLKVARRLKVVIDSGNGTAALTAPELFSRLGCQVIELYCEVDGTFPNHHPDPTKLENLQDLISRVKREQADLGVGFDGDGDRIGVVSPSGRVVWGDQLLIIFCRQLLKENPGAKIISEVKASQVFFDEVKKLGGEPIMWKTGHSLIKKKIYEERALLAGEMSGHIFFNDRWFGFDDAVYAGARLIELLAAADENLDQILDTIPAVVNTPEIRVDTTEEKKFLIVEAVKRHFQSKYQVIDIDGARIIFADGWALVRASNTQPSLVVRYEARSEESLEKIRSEVEAVLQRELQA